MPSVRNIAVAKLPSKREKYTIIIPAAGKGTRMITYGPKPLIKLNTGNVLDRQIAMIDKVVNVFDVIMVTGFQSDKVINKAPDYVTSVVNEDYENNNVVASIGLGLERVKTDKVIIIYGDLVFNEQMLQAPMSHESMLLMGNMKKDEVGCVVENRYVQQMCYDLPDKWAQIMFLTDNELEMMCDLTHEPRSRNMFGFEAINYIINNGGHFKAFSPKGGKIIDIDSSKDIAVAKKI